MLTTTQINRLNYSVSDGGKYIGHLIKRTIGANVGWYFVANTRDLATVYPENDTPESSPKLCLQTMRRSAIAREADEVRQ